MPLAEFFQTTATITIPEEPTSMTGAPKGSPVAGDSQPNARSRKAPREYEEDRGEWRSPDRGAGPCLSCLHRAGPGPSGCEDRRGSFDPRVTTHGRGIEE